MKRPRRKNGNKAHADAGVEGPPPTGFNLGAVKGLAIAALSLLLAAAAVVFFSVLQTVVDCEFRPVTYAIFTGIVLASVGAILGGQAAVKGNLPRAGVTWSITGGAAFLVLVMVAVWWATRGDCKVTAATLRLSSIPTKYTVALREPSLAEKQLRIRFDQNVAVKQFSSHDEGWYDLYFVPKQQTVKIQLDLISISRGKSAQICQISIRPARPNEADVVQILSETSNDPVAFKLKDGFVEEVHNKYDFKGPYEGSASSCLQVEYTDKSGKRTQALVDDIIFVEANVANRLDRGIVDDLSQLTRSFRVYARIGAGQPPSAVREGSAEPPQELHGGTVPVRSDPAGHCPPAVLQAQSGLSAIIIGGGLSEEDLKAVSANWCALEQEVYAILRKLTALNWMRYNLVRFIRSSITSIDVCWTSSDSYRQKNPDRCNPRLDEPRDFSRPLPFAQKREQKQDLLNLLRDGTTPTRPEIGDDSGPLRREVEALLRSYPHDEFDGLFDEHLKSIGAAPAEVRQRFAMAAIGYYYNRVVERQWSKSMESAGALDRDLAQGRKWADKISGPDAGAARARLHYARAHVYAKLAQAPNQVRTDFAELLKLTPEEMTAYPYPLHIARAVVNNSGRTEDRPRFNRLDDTKLTRQPVSTTDKFDSANYEPSLIVVPDPAGTEIAKLGPADKIRILMHFIPDPKKKTENAWDFVWTTQGAGWVRLASKST